MFKVLLTIDIFISAKVSCTCWIPKYLKTLFSVAGRFPDSQYKSLSFLCKMFFSLPLLLFWNTPCVYFLFLTTILVPYLSDSWLSRWERRLRRVSRCKSRVRAPSYTHYFLQYCSPLYCMVSSVVLVMKSPHNSIIPAPYKKPFYKFINFFQK